MHNIHYYYFGTSIACNEVIPIASYMSSRSGHHMLGFKSQFQYGRPGSHLGWIKVMNFKYAQLQAQPSSLHLVSCLHLLWVWRSSEHKKFNMAARQPFWNEVWPKKVHWPHAYYFNNSPDRYEAIPIPRLWVIGDTKRGRTDGLTDGRTDGRMDGRTDAG